MSNRIRSILVIVLITCTLFVACTDDNNNTPNGNTVTDAAGNVLQIPNEPTESKIASTYAVAVPFIVALNLADQVVAINCKSVFWTDNVPALAKAGTVGRVKVDLEALAKAKPSVLIYRTNDEKTVTAVNNLGVDVLCISAENMDGIKSTLNLVGIYFEKSERAKEVIAWIDAKYALVDSVAAGIPEKEKKTAIVMGSEPGRIAGGDMLQSWMIEKAGGICSAKDVSNNGNWVMSGTESVLSWNPEYIFCTSSTPLDYDPASLGKDAGWKNSRAASQGHIYSIPAKKDSWDLPGIACVIGTMYMLHEMYPARFTAEELQTQIDEYYEFMFSRTFTPDELGYAIS
jgi:ABC-type Fe3+-hydroxamate transport system substrate-binding protein